MNSEARKEWRVVFVKSPANRLALLSGMMLLLSIVWSSDCAGQGVSETLSDARRRDARGESLESIAERELRKKTAKPSAKKTAQTSSTKTVRNAEEMPSRLELWKRRRAAKGAETR
jgi:hypothetical protein